jgi:hypothetical protein
MDPTHPWGYGLSKDSEDIEGASDCVILVTDVSLVPSHCFALETSWSLMKWLG